MDLKQAFRSLQKNKLFSVFNIFGFAIGFTVCIITVSYTHLHGLSGTLERQDKSYNLNIRKVYPEVRQGQSVSYTHLNQFF